MSDFPNIERRLESGEKLIIFQHVDKIAVALEQANAKQIRQKMVFAAFWQNWPFRWLIWEGDTPEHALQTFDYLVRKRRPAGLEVFSRQRITELDQGITEILQMVEERIRRYRQIEVTYRENRKADEPPFFLAEFDLVHPDATAQGIIGTDATTLFAALVGRK